MTKTHAHYEAQRLNNIIRAELRESRLAAKQTAKHVVVSQPRKGAIGWCTRDGNFYSVAVTLVAALPTPFIPHDSDDKSRLTRSLVESCRGLREMGRSPQLP